MIIIDWLKEYFNWVYQTWNRIAYEWIPSFVPDFLIIGSHDRWQWNALVIAFWVGIYALFAWLYFKFVGKPVYWLIGFLHEYNMKVLPWWHAVIYIYLLIYSTSSGFIFSIKTRHFDLTPIILLLPVLIYYIVKAKWRIILIPFILTGIYTFWLGAFFVFFPVVVVWIILIALGVTASTLGSPSRYCCPNCKHEISYGSDCPYCGTGIEW